jgi:N-hydroxyarylamine O-acetyltransferase
MFDLDAYLERIGLSGRPGLGEIHRAHSTSIPFENLDPLRGIAVSLDPDDLQRKLVQERRGGYCFEQNLLLRAALQATGGGVEIDMHLARVRYGANGAIRPRSHIVLGIRGAGGHWLADVGFGMGTPFEPLPFEPGHESEQSGWRFRLVAEARGEMALQRIEGGGWIDLYAFSLEPVPFIDVETSNWWVCTHPRSPFVNGLIVASQDADGSWASVNERNGPLQLVERSPADSKSVSLDRAQLPGLLAERFGLHGFALDGEGRLLR